MKRKIFGILLGVAMLIPFIGTASASEAGTQSVGGFFVIKNFWTQRCLLGLPGRVHPGNCGNQNDRLWFPHLNADGSRSFILRATGACLDADNDDAPNPPSLDGSPMQTHECLESITSERWTVETLDQFTGRAHIKSALGNYCLDNNNGNSPTVIWTCDATNHNQDWVFA